MNKMKVFFFFSIFLSTGQSFVLPSIPPKPAGGCYQTPPKNHGEDPTGEKTLDEQLDEKQDEGSDSWDKNLDETLKSIHEKLDRLDTFTELLVAESARERAARKFGEDFSRSTIKSVHYDEENDTFIYVHEVGH